VINYRRLAVWHKAHHLALSVYRNTRSFPKSERFGLVSQLRRAAVSVPSNLAEGAGRDTPRDFMRFVSIAAGSASELQYQLKLAGDLGYLNSNQATELGAAAHEVKKMLHGLLRAHKAVQR